jgi:hypothetical protein
MTVEIKLMKPDDPNLESIKRKDRKVTFLNMELQDIKNNKGTLTLQVKSIEHL